MLIQMLRNPSRTLDCSLLEGQTGEVSDSLGRKLVALRIAIDVTPAELPKTVEAVPEEPAVIGVPDVSTTVPKKRS